MVTNHHEASPDAFSAMLRTPLPAVRADLLSQETEPMKHGCEGHMCYCDRWTDLSSVDLIVNSTNIATMSYSSDHISKMNENATSNCVSDADLRFDVVEWSYTDLGSSETPPYSHDIYASCSPGNGYLVGLDDINAVLDCDISTLDAYLHSTPCTPTSDAELPGLQPLSDTSTVPSSNELLPKSDINPVEEFFPNLCEASTSSATTPDVQRRNSSGTIRSSGSRYSPYSAHSTSPCASDEYRIKRDKNNLASQRSRQKRAEKMREMRTQRENLERRNIELKALLSSLEVQVADYKRIVLMMVSKSASNA